MLAFPATLRQLVVIIVSCSTLAGCTPIRGVERFDLAGFWQTDGYVCRGVSTALPVRIVHDGSTLRAFRRLDDDCGMYGDISWQGEFPSGQVSKAALPITFSVLVNLQKAEERARLDGVASVISRDALTIRISDGTRYSLVRELEPAGLEDLPQGVSSTDITDQRETMSKPGVTGRARDGAGANGGPQQPQSAHVISHGSAGKTADVSLAGMGANPSGSGGNFGTNLSAPSTGGSGGMTAADGGSLDSDAADSGAADSGAAAGAPATMSDAGMTNPAATDAGAPTTSESRPTDRWLCTDSLDTDGLPRCVCDVDSRRHTDSCKLPKPTCCFVFQDIGEQCICYQEGSQNCENFSDQLGIFRGRSVPTCPP